MKIEEFTAIVVRFLSNRVSLVYMHLFQTQNCIKCRNFAHYVNVVLQRGENVYTILPKLLKFPSFIVASIGWEFNLANVFTSRLPLNMTTNYAR